MTINRISEVSRLTYRIGALLVYYLARSFRSPGYLITLILSFSLIAASASLMFAVREGLKNTINADGERGLYFITNAQAASDLLSRIPLPQVTDIRSIILNNNNAGKGSIVSPEIAIVSKQNINKEEKNFIVRGISDQAFRLKNIYSGKFYLEVVDGRRPKSDADEVIVGKLLAEKYRQFAIGESVYIHGRPWRIVGTFISDGSMRESEFWTDLEHLRSEYKLENFVNVIVFSDYEGKEKSYHDLLPGKDAYKLAIKTSDEMYTAGSVNIYSFVSYIIIGVICFTSLTVIAGTSALAESMQIKQADDLRLLFALGFGKERFLTFILEVMLYCVVGVIAGQLICILLFNKTNLSTIIGSREVVFVLSLNYHVLAICMLYCMVLSFISSCVAVFRSNMNDYK